MQKKKDISLNISGINLTQTQQMIYDKGVDYNKKFLIVNCSRQQGKSTVCRVLLTVWLLEPNSKVIYITPFFKLAKTLYKEIYDLLEQTPFIKRQNQSDLYIELTNKSTLIFFSGNSIEAVRGQSATYVIIDEQAFISDVAGEGDDLWNNVLSPIWKVKGKKVLLISTPSGKSGFFYEQYCKGEIDNTNYDVIKRTIYEDGLINAEQIEEIKNNITELQFKQEFLVEFLDNANTYFINFDKCFDGYQFDFSRPLWAGIDFSSIGTDETVFTFINDINQTKQYVIKGELNSKYQQIADLITLNKMYLRGIYAESNSIGAVMINQLLALLDKQSQRKIEPFSTTNSSKNDYISALQLDISKQLILFEKDDKELFGQFGTFICRISKSRRLTFASKQGHKDDRIISLALQNYAKKNLNRNESIDYVFL